MSSLPRFTQQFINFPRSKGGSQLRCNKVQIAVNQDQGLQPTNNNNVEFLNSFSSNYSTNRKTNDDDQKQEEQERPVKRRKIRRAKKSKEISDMLSIPPEIFVNICKFLPPNDLVSLSKVCKLYYNYLCSDNIQCTQNIWKISRENHLTKLQLPPPEGMNERQYCKLFVERGCQICKKARIRKVYWAFRVRCCKDCLIKHTKSVYKIFDELKIPAVVLNGLTYTTQRFWTRWNREFLVKFYWLSKVREMESEYNALQPNQRSKWANDMRIKGKKEMDDVNMRT